MRRRTASAAPGVLLINSRPVRPLPGLRLILIVILILISRPAPPSTLLLHFSTLTPHLSTRAVRFSRGPALSLRHPLHLSLRPAQIPTRLNHSPPYTP